MRVFLIKKTHEKLHFLNYFNEKYHVRLVCYLIAKVSPCSSYFDLMPVLYYDK